MNNSKVQSAEIDTYLAPWHSLAQVSTLTHMSALEIEAAAGRRELIGIRFNNGQLYFPARQFHDGASLSGLAQVIAVLADAIDDPETWAVWLTGPYASPVDHTSAPSMWAALAAGQLSGVLILAGRDSRSWTS